MADSETHFQERPQRPTFATKEDLVAHVAAIVRNRIADSLALAVTDYFIGVGVMATVAQGQAPLRATRPDLHRALASFARSRRCPPILRYIVPGLNGELFAEPPPHRMADRGEIYDQLEAEHPQHLASLAGFGDRAQEVCRSIELCVFMLLPDPADYPKPSLIAAALRISAAIEEDLQQLGEQSASMSDVEKLIAFRERLNKLRWKHTFCKEGSRPASAPLPPRRGIRTLPGGPTAFDHEEPEPPPPDPVALERIAWEREAGKQWRDAHALSWHEVVVPVVQSCRDVGELAQKHAAGEDLIALTVTAHRELLRYAIDEPNETALKALDDMEAGMDLLRVRVTVAEGEPPSLAGNRAAGGSPMVTRAAADGAGCPSGEPPVVPAKPTTDADGARDAPPVTATLPSAEFDYTKSSEAAVTAIVRALGQLRTTAPDVMPYKERIKETAGVTGGAGDRAIECAMRNKLITPDLLVTTRGQAFLKDRS